MRVTDDELRRTYQAASTRSDRAGCPGADVLASLATGELGKAERRSLLEHVASCGDCAREVQLAGDAAPWSAELSRDLAALTATPAGSTERVAPVQPRRSWRSWRFAPAVAMASALLAVAIGLWVAIAPPAARDDVLRGDDVEVVPMSGSELVAPPERLAWPAQAGATGYRVVIFDARAERVWESAPLLEAELALPDEVLGRLDPGATYLWVVEVAGSAARTELGPYRFRLAAN